MVKEYVKEIGGSVFTAYDEKDNPVDITIAKANRRYKNKNKRSVSVNRDLTGYLDKRIKQEAITLIDELVATSKYNKEKKANYSHGWLDNFGKNNWEYWTTYIQDKENTVWKATLNIANSANGEKILYDISPIKKVEGAIKLATTATDNSIRQSTEKSQGKISDFEKNFSDTKTDGADVRYSFRNTETGMANNFLIRYNKEMSSLIEKTGNVIVDSYDKLVEQVNRAFDKPKEKATLYFGILDKDILSDINDKIPNLPREMSGSIFKKGRQYSVAATLDSIRHLIDDKKGMTKEDVIDYLDRFADAIVDNDSVSFASYNRGNLKIDGLLFKKAFPDGTILTFDLVSNGKKVIGLQTIYMDKAGYKKRKFAKPLMMQNAPTKTSETHGGQTFNPNDSTVPEKSQGNFTDRTTGENIKYSVRKEAPPEKTLKGYKVFVVKDGKLYPPMVANPNAEDTPIGVWLNADIGAQAPDSKTGRKQVKAGGKGTQGGSGSLAFRPGWHLGETPLATQFDRLNPKTGVKDLFPENFVWAECDIAADVDYQEEAMSYGYNKNGNFQHSLAGLPKLPENGYYRYRTNPNPNTVPWLITGAMKVNRLLSDAEVNEILAEKGIAPKQRQGGNKTLADLGLGQYENVNFSARNTDNLNPTNNADIRYSLREGAKEDVEKALKEKDYTEDVCLTESSPSIIASQNGVRNLPMLMKASHIRENVLTKEEALERGLKADSHTHYHGLGEELFLKIIGGLDEVQLAYRGTKNADNAARRENYFLLISQYKDAKGNIVNVPVYINEKAQYNRIFVDTNKIATVFGRDNFFEYIRKEVQNGNLARIKNKNKIKEADTAWKTQPESTSVNRNINQVSELKALIASSYNKSASDNRSDRVGDRTVQKTEGYGSNVSDNIILQKSENSQEKFSVRNPDATDNRTLLSNALASAAQNAIEKKYIEQYQEKIDTVNAEQEKLAGLKAKIKELSFAPGKRNTEQIRNLQDQAIKTANRINVYDKLSGVYFAQKNAAFQRAEKQYKNAKNPDNH